MIMDDTEGERRDGSPQLSVVIVTYNEADRIEACLDAVFDACRTLETFEVILVDSNSSDNTVDITRSYPISILRLRNDEITTPGAGRYVGTKVARGDSILFVDGDVVMSEAWLPPAMAALEAENVAGVDGPLNSAGDGTSIREVDAISGVALYDGSLLRATNSFNPKLEALEDIELGFRLRKEGYRLLRVPIVAGTHPVSDGLTEPFRRWRSGYCLSTGQMLQLYGSSPRDLLGFIRQETYTFIIPVWFILGILSAITVPFLGGMGVLLWFGFSVLGFVAITAKLGLKPAIRFCMGKVLTLDGMVRGLRRSHYPDHDIPMDMVETVKSGEIQTTQRISTL